MKGRTHWLIRDEGSESTPRYSEQDTRDRLAMLRSVLPSRRFVAIRIETTETEEDW